MTAIYKQAQVSQHLFYLGEKPKAIPKTTDHLPCITLLLLVLQKEQAESYAKGFEQGLQKGKEEALLALEETQKQCHALLQSIPQAVSENRFALQAEIADILLAIIQPWFIHNQTNRAFLEQQINHILKQVNSQDQVELCLHPDDLHLLKQGKIHCEGAHLHDLKITAHTGLQLGGCLVKSSHGIFDASIESQIERLKEILLELKQGAADAGSH
jgi:flagellar assembly protein FliH